MVKPDIRIRTHIGAFGVVHKGEFVDPDGSMIPIAIKTIKCKQY